MDILTASDQAHRTALETGSRNLLNAIRAAREGTCPATPVAPIGLPRDYTNASGPKADTYERIGASHGSVDHVEVLMKRGKLAADIAEELGVTLQKATWMMHGVRKRRTPSELDLAMRAKLWG